MTRHLLVFSRKQAIQPVALNLNELIRDLEKMLRRVIGDDVEFVTTLADDLPPVKADLGQMEQVIMNLVVNARDAMPRGGAITIETRAVDVSKESARRNMAGAAGPHVMTSVADTGIGMNEETLSHVFEPFFTTKERSKGTGLGLSTAYGIIKQSGGFITAHSRPGAGAVFRIYLPCAEGEPVRANAPVAEAAALEGTETVLLVEDDDVVRHLTRTILEDAGYTVMEARHGGDALLICERRKAAIDLLLTDVVMPGVSGRKLGEYLPTIRPEMKVLYMSGYTDGPLTQLGDEGKEAAFIQKPFTPFALKTKVREVLDLS